MANNDRIKVNNANLQRCIDKANNLPDKTGTTPPQYKGEYVVTPSTEMDIVLETARKLLVEDVTVNKIPYYEVSNNSGGITVFIGNEV
jgi:hypothetical protein